MHKVKLVLSVVLFPFCFSGWSLGANSNDGVHPPDLPVAATGAAKPHSQLARANTDQAPPEIMASEVEGLVQKFLDASNVADAAGLAALYADQAKYFSKNAYSRTEIREDKEDFFDDWPVLRYRRVGDIVISETPRADELEVNFNLDYRVSNPGNDERRVGEGRSWVTLVVQRIDGELKIISISEKVKRRR